jgi:putative SbcD/Mre11-related phosphoesterase
LKLVRPYPALLLEEEHERFLVVADLHIGWEGALAEKGIHLPSQTPRFMKKILRLIRSCNPTGLIFLGDVKHSIAKVKTEEWQAIPDLFETLTEQVSDIRVIPGNHDGGLEALLPTSVTLVPTKGIAIGSVGVFHGHAWPAPELLGCQTLVTGHVHPMVAFRDPLGFRITRQVWVKARCDKTRLAKALLKYLNIKVDTDPVSSLEQHFDMKVRAENLFIMPSFNDFLGGQLVNRKGRGKGAGSRFIGPILRSKSVDFNEAELFLLDGTFIGTVEQLSSSV